MSQLTVPIVSTDAATLSDCSALSWDRWFLSHRSECPNVPAITPTGPRAYLTCQTPGGLPYAPLPRAKDAREGDRQNRAMNAGTAADFGPLSLKTHQWSRLTSPSFSHSAAISLRTA